MRVGEYLQQHKHCKKWGGEILQQRKFANMSGFAKNGTTFYICTYVFSKTFRQNLAANFEHYIIIHGKDWGVFPITRKM